MIIFKPGDKVIRNPNTPQHGLKNKDLIVEEFINKPSKSNLKLKGIKGWWAGEYFTLAKRNNHRKISWL